MLFLQGQNHRYWWSDVSDMYEMYLSLYWNRKKTILKTVVCEAKYWNRLCDLFHVCFWCLCNTDGYAPFNSLADRDTMLVSESVLVAPGPGQYDPKLPQETVKVFPYHNICWICARLKFFSDSAYMDSLLNNFFQVLCNYDHNDCMHLAFWVYHI